MQRERAAATTAVVAVMTAMAAMSEAHLEVVSVAGLEARRAEGGAVMRRLTRRWAACLRRRRAMDLATRWAFSPLTSRALTVPGGAIRTT